MTERAGGCACGRVRFVAEVTSDDAYLCHCRMCQRATGSVSIAFADVPRDGVRWLTAPDWYVSSPIARRPFCASCGTSLGFDFSDGKSAKIDLTVASFDDPGFFRCVAHCAPESRLERWHARAVEGLPEHRLADNPATRDRWLAATGKVPD